MSSPLLLSLAEWHLSSFILLDDWSKQKNHPSKSGWLLLSLSSGWSYLSTSRFCAIFGLHSLHMHGLGGKAVLGNGGWAHVLKKVTVCCFAVLHFVKVVTPQVPTFQPIAIHLLLPHPLPLVHQPLGSQWHPASSCPAPVSTNTTTSVQPPGKASWSHLSWLSQLMLLKAHVRFEAKRLCQCRSKF